MTLLGLKQFYIKNVGPAKIQRVQQKIPGCWTYVQQNENKFQKVCLSRFDLGPEGPEIIKPTTTI
jgi:hypothetical protein